MLALGKHVDDYIYLIFFLVFRAKNNDHLVIKSEMSCFINPWSKKVDFVIGQMSIIRSDIQHLQNVSARCYVNIVLRHTFTKKIIH